MTVRAKRIYIPLFIVVLLAQLYIPSFRLNILLQIFTLIFLVVIDRVAFSKSYVKHLLPFILLLILGFAGTFLHKYKIFNIIKDITHFIKPLTGFLIGYILFRKINDFRVFAKTIVTASVLSAVIHLGIVAILLKLNANTIHEIREFTRDNFLELFGLLFVFAYRRFYREPLFKSRIYYVVAIVLLFLSISLYFSRTMIIAGIILAVSVLGFTKINSTSLKLIAFMFVATGLFYTYLYNTNIRRDAPGIEGFFYKVKIAPAEVFETNINRDNHADLWDHWRGYEAKRAFELMKESPSSFIFGTGHGSLVNLRFFAPLTGDRKGIRYISELHNGYMYVFYKTGIIGLLIYLFVILRWYMYAYKFAEKNMIALLISAIGAIFLFSTLTITGMYNNKDILIMLVGALLHFIHAQKYKRNSETVAEPIKHTD